MHTKTWHVEIFLSEDGGTTHARAVLSTGEAAELSASGLARRNPHDPDVAEIGDELAAARALNHLAGHLLRVVREDVGESTGQPATFSA